MFSKILYLFPFLIHGLAVQAGIIPLRGNNGIARRFDESHIAAGLDVQHSSIGLSSQPVPSSEYSNFSQCYGLRNDQLAEDCNVASYAEENVHPPPGQPAAHVITASKITVISGPIAQTELKISERRPTDSPVDAGIIATGGDTTKLALEPEIGMAKRDIYYKCEPGFYEDMEELGMSTDAMDQDCWCIEREMEVMEHATQAYPRMKRDRNVNINTNAAHQVQSKVNGPQPADDEDAPDAEELCEGPDCDDSDNDDDDDDDNGDDHNDDDHNDDDKNDCCDENANCVDEGSGTCDVDSVDGVGGADEADEEDCTDEVDVKDGKSCDGSSSSSCNDNSDDGNDEQVDVDGIDDNDIKDNIRDKDPYTGMIEGLGRVFGMEIGVDAVRDYGRQKVAGTVPLSVANIGHQA